MILAILFFVVVGLVICGLAAAMLSSEISQREEIYMTQPVDYDTLYATWHSQLPAAVAAKLVAFFDMYRNGHCPRCQQPLTGEKQVGPCVYAEPCGCRLWQGQARRSA